MPKLQKILKMETEMTVVTGIKIGGPQDKFDIGGIDNPVVRTVVSKEFLKETIGVDENILNKIAEDSINIPYIPGSSLKGRMRALLELEEGKAGKDGDISTEEPFRSVFGVPAEKREEREMEEEISVTRAIFSDAYPTKETIERWIELEEEEKTFDLGTELKIENKINRLTGGTFTFKGGLRKMERVIPGSKFKIEVKVLIFDKDVDREEEFKKLIEKGFRLIEKTYLGGSGTRGYGKVKFGEFKWEKIPVEQLN